MTYRCLKSAVHVSKERMSVAELKHTPLNQCTIDIVVLKYHVFA